MSYPFFDIYVNNIAKTPKQNYRDDVQELMNDQFYDSSDWYTVQEETSFASGTYQNIDVRINRVINPTTGANRGDDWKLLIFKDISKDVPVGSLFIFESNYWLTVNTENINTLTSSCIIRRCNNTLRWIDLDGGYNNVPCVLDYIIQENRDYSTAGSSIVNPSGILQVMAQMNAKSNLIRPNQRFLFGNATNWTAYKVFGGGINNFDAQQTSINSSTGLLKLTMGVNFDNVDTDDLVNGIASYYEHVYVVTLSHSTISGIIGQEVQLSAIVTMNGDTVTRDLTWTSSDEAIATVDTTGLVTFIDDGTCTITCTLENNSTVYDTCAVTVSGIVPVDDYVILVTPETNFIYEGSNRTYEVYLYENGIVQVDTFVFSVESGSTVPTENYFFNTLTDNSFIIYNIEKYLEENLVIECVSGLYSKNVEIKLIGAW